MSEHEIPGEPHPNCEPVPVDTRKSDGGEALTREELWERLPGAVRVNEVRFKSVMVAGVPKDWLKEGGGRQAGSHRYWLASTP